MGVGVQSLAGSYLEYLNYVGGKKLSFYSTVKEITIGCFYHFVEAFGFL